MKVRELVTTWGWNIDTEPLNKMKESIASVRETVMHLGELVLGEGASLFGLAEMTADAGVGFQRVAESVGTTTTKLQELNFAAKQWDVAPRAIETALSHLSRMTVMAAQGSSQAIRTLSMAGIHSFIDPKTGNMLRSDQLLVQVAAHFRGLRNDAMKAGLSMQVFGRSGKEIVPLLNRMEEFGEKSKEGLDLGYVMGPEAIAAAEKFKHATNLVRSALVGIRNTIGVALMPAVEDMVAQVIKWYKANRQLLTSQVVEFAQQLSGAVKGAFEMMMLAVKGVMFLAHHLGGLGNVLKVVTVGFIAWTALSTITGIMEITEAVIKLSSALELAAIWEGIASGGVSTILGVAAVAASLGIGAYALNKMTSATPMALNSTRGGTTVHHTDNRRFDINLPPGTPQEHAQALTKLLSENKATDNRAAAYAGSSPVSY